MKHMAGNMEMDFYKQQFYSQAPAHTTYPPRQPPLLHPTRDKRLILWRNQTREAPDLGRPGTIETTGLKIGLSKTLLTERQDLQSLPLLSSQNTGS